MISRGVYADHTRLTFRTSHVPFSFPSPHQELPPPVLPAGRSGGRVLSRGCKGGEGWGGRERRGGRGGVGGSGMSKDAPGCKDESMQKIHCTL